MSPWSFDPSEEDDQRVPFGMPSPHAPEGRDLIGANTPLGFGRMRWTETGKAWLSGDGFDLPLTHFDTSTLEPVYGPKASRNGWPHIGPLPDLAGSRNRAGSDNVVQYATARSAAGASGAVDPASSTNPVTSASVGNTQGRPSSTGVTAAQIADAYSKARSVKQQRTLEKQFDIRQYRPANDRFRERFARRRPGDDSLPIHDVLTPEEMIQGLISGSIDAEQLNRTAMRDLGPGIKRALRLKGARVVRVPTKAGDHPPFNKRRPNSEPARGYSSSEQRPVTELPGTYEEKDVILAINRPYYKRPDPSDPAQASLPNSSNMNHHEPIHGFDQEMGNLHSSPEFIRAWAADIPYFLDDQGGKYYKPIGNGGTQTPDGALSDAFAETGALFYNDREEMERRFPNTFRYWTELHRQLEAGILPQ